MQFVPYAGPAESSGQLDQISRLYHRLTSQHCLFILPHATRAKVILQRIWWKERFWDDQCIRSRRLHGAAPRGGCRERPIAAPPYRGLTEVRFEEERSSINQCIPDPSGETGRRIPIGLIATLLAPNGELQPIREKKSEKLQRRTDNCSHYLVTEYSESFCHRFTARV